MKSVNTNYDLMVEESLNNLEGASYFSRCVAYIIDILPIVFLVAFICYFLLGYDVVVQNHFNDRDNLKYTATFYIYRNTISFISLLIWSIVSGYTDCSVKQVTLGKRIMGLKVVDYFGQPLSKTQSFKRNVGSLHL